MKALANRIGRDLLSFQNPRVVSPPGIVMPDGRRNLIVATPMRSGTHVLIDALLNNIPALRRRPLYIDLDQFMIRRDRFGADHGPLQDRAGYLVKTHYPILHREPEGDAAEIEALARDGFVVTVRRPLASIVGSLEKWASVESGSAKLPALIAAAETNPAACRAFWDPRADMVLDFAELFDPEAMARHVARIAEEIGAVPAPRYRHPPRKSQRSRIYVDKALTRLLGRRAPRINTTIRVS
ncbi:MAG: hypothetical protein CML46_16850 [Rhodobacteraceae bacterium]|nr:hypothetical protein [Paracoccaceae bacterium]